LNYRGDMGIISIKMGVILSLSIISRFAFEDDYAWAAKADV